MVSPGFPFWFVVANKAGIHKSQMRRYSILMIYKHLAGLRPGQDLWLEL